jgi:hypothetical protein
MCTFFVGLFLAAMVTSRGRRYRGRVHGILLSDWTLFDRWGRTSIPQSITPDPRHEQRLSEELLAPGAYSVGDVEQG